MKPFVFQYKSITITWYMLFLVLALGFSYLLFKILINKYDKEYKEKLDDMFFYVALLGFVGARFTYVLFNFDSFRGKIMPIIKPSQHNLSLVGGIVVGLITLYLLSKKYKIDFFSSISKLLPPFYLAMAIGVWHFHFNILLSPVSGIKMGSLYLSLLFLIGLILELILGKKLKNKYISLVILVVVISLYKLI